MEIRKSTNQDKVATKLATITHISANSLFGAIGAFFLLQIYGFFIFEIFLSYLNPINWAIIFVLPFLALFLGIQSGILSIVYIALFRSSFAKASPFVSTIEFARLILAAIFFSYSYYLFLDFITPTKDMTIAWSNWLVFTFFLW